MNTNKNISRKCSLCKFYYFLDKNFNYGRYLCDGCYDMSLKATSMQNLAIVYHGYCLLDSINLNKIVVSSKCKLYDTTYKYFCGYLNNDVIQPLCVILPQMSGYIKYFDDGGKNMSFVTNDGEVYKKYNEIWEVVRKLLKSKFTVSPIRDDKYILAKLKIFNKINRTAFTNNIVPLEKKSLHLHSCNRY